MLTSLSGLPMLIISPIPGQEASNTSYLIEAGAALAAGEPVNLATTLSYIHDNPNILKSLSDSALRISKPNAAQDIAEFILTL